MTSSAHEGVLAHGLMDRKAAMARAVDLLRQVEIPSPEVRETLTRVAANYSRNRISPDNPEADLVVCATYLHDCRGLEMHS